METRALRYFQTVAEFGSYSRASGFLRISQPAISRQIRKLEEEVGAALFKRHGHGVSLTEAGRILLERSQLALRQLEQTKAEIRGGRTGPSGVLSFAVPPAAGHFLVPTLVERFGRDYPNVFLKVIGGFSGYIHEWLVRGQVDLACVHDPLPQRGFEVTPLVREQVYLVGKPGAARFGRDHARIDDLADLPLVLPSRPNASRRLLDSWIAQKGISLNVRMEADDSSLLRSLVKQGAGFSLLTQGAIADDLRLKEVQAWPLRPRAYWPLALVTSASTPRSDILAAFIAAIRKTARDLTVSGAWPGKSLDRG
ncbi:MAG TPA: LysR family transcriptional regulator [Stellaceae bacterium]|nr:LysR family transcriptional regulator [Stellaceae bacterium]